MIVYYACIFLFDFTCCHAICLLVLVNSDAHIGPGVINLEINLEILLSAIADAYLFIVRHAGKYSRTC